ncbi:hypothetical protein NVP1029O_80 [Vibrio phage 1.029.O._10N.261.55.A7]|nr:hypothetical protein NVP1029O_80 [Vibrio phage 1.029.O._10N.261.55.A7]
MSDFCFGGNTEDKSDKMWNVANRYNHESRQINGHVTVTKRRQVAKSRPVPLR